MKQITSILLLLIFMGCSKSNTNDIPLDSQHFIFKDVVYIPNDISFVHQRVGQEFRIEYNDKSQVYIMVVLESNSILDSVSCYVEVKDSTGNNLYTDYKKLDTINFGLTYLVKYKPNITYDGKKYTVNDSFEVWENNTGYDTNKIKVYINDVKIYK